MSDASGIAVNGILIYNAVTSSNVDALSETEVSFMDYCLQHSVNGIMHHHSISPCVSATPYSVTVSPKFCNDGTCLKNNFMTSNWYKI